MNNILIMVNYNDFKNVYKLYENIKKYKIIDKIIIVDNGSKDDSLKKIKEIKDDKIIIIENNKNLGYGRAINIACKYIKEKYKEANLIISNTDIIINNENDIKILINDIERKEIKAVAPIIKQNEEYLCGWKIPTIKDALLLNIPKYNKKYEKEKINYNINNLKKRLNKAEVLSGSFFIIKLSTLYKIGLFDENIFLYYEENILFYKMKELKFDSYIDTKVEIIHNHSVTIDNVMSKKNKLKELKKSQEYFYKNIYKCNWILYSILKITNKIILILK